MQTPRRYPPRMAADEENGVAERLKAVADALEEIVADRSLLEGAVAGGAHAAARGGRGRPQPRRRPAAPLQQGRAPREEGGEGRPRRERARRDGHPRPPREAGVHDAERLRARASSSSSTSTRPEFREVVEPQHCYVCKERYQDIHPFYDQLCPACAAFNFRKRSETADLSGRVALLTGGRVKIGYQAGIKLLRAGAQLIVTTRFPRDAAARYAAEPDFEEWGDRLEVFGLDLRHTPSVEAFCSHLSSTRERLDFIVNNACQTVRRPSEFYRHMLEAETASEESMPAARARPARRLRGAAPHRHAAGGSERHAAGARRGHALGRALAGAAAAGGSGAARRPLPGGPARPGSAAGRPARAQLVAAPARRGARRSSCSRRSSSTPSRRSCSTRA